MFKLQSKLLLYLTLVFMGATVAGTISHEEGHYMAARLLGYNAHISFRSTATDFEEAYQEIKRIRDTYSSEIQANIDFPERKNFYALNNKLASDNFWITLAGPLQTMLAGSFGLICILFYRRDFSKNKTLPISLWVFIFFALFWLREPANFMMSISQMFFSGTCCVTGDEFQLARFLEWPLWTILVPAAAIGAGVMILVLYVLPKQIRVTFMLSGLIGGPLGFGIWFFVLGKELMP